MKIEQQQWTKLAHKARRQKIYIQSALLIFLVVVTAPVIVPFIWLVTVSLTDARRGVDSSLLWQVLTIAVPAIFVSGFFSAYLQELKHNKLFS